MVIGPLVSTFGRRTIRTLWSGTQLVHTIYYAKVVQAVASYSEVKFSAARNEISRYPVRCSTGRKVK